MSVIDLGYAIPTYGKNNFVVEVQTRLGSGRFKRRGLKEYSDERSNISVNGKVV